MLMKYASTLSAYVIITNNHDARSSRIIMVTFGDVIDRKRFGLKSLRNNTAGLDSARRKNDCKFVAANSMNRI